MTAVSPSRSNPPAPMSTTATTAGRQAARGAPLSEEAILILEEREIDIELAVALGVRGSKKKRTGEVWIEFPYLEGEEEINFKARTISGEKQFYQEAGRRKIFYNQNDVAVWQQSPNDALIICEGEFDCLIAKQAGYLAVSVPDGAPAKRVENEESLKYSFLEGFPKVGTVVIAADADEAGANLLHDLADRLGKRRCKWVRYPKGNVTQADGTTRPIKDLNDVWQVYGEKGVVATINRAEWFKVDGVYRMSDLPPHPGA